MKYQKFMKVSSINLNIDDASYPIVVGNGVLSQLKNRTNKICPNAKKIAIIIDKNIPNKFKKKIRAQLKKYKLFIKEYRPDEKLKNFKNANILVEYLIKKNFNRNDIIIAVGGGIIGDFVGFVASILKRGVNFINLPSTLLSQVDSSIGGKTGVNSTSGKNLIGSFYQPKLVISELSLLKSLPKREIICGFAEILKYSLIRDKKFFTWIKKNSKKILVEKNINSLHYAIVKSCKNKIYFVSNDEKEKGKRMLLNFGHTFAHGIEAANKFSKKINHGEAVLIGMMLATKVSYKKGICNQNTLNEIKKIYIENKLPSDLKKYFSKSKYDKIVTFMISDKKNDDDKISFILLRRIGQTTKPGEMKMLPKSVSKILKKIN
tara:strand:+ start:2533 stop:3660 length:1128 start_codon:yes stop_codon:yes gene_type:complete